MTKKISIEIIPTIVKVNYNEELEELKIYYEVNGIEEIRLFSQVSLEDYELFEKEASKASYYEALKSIQEDYCEFEYQIFKIKNNEPDEHDIDEIEIITPLYFDETQFNIDSKKCKPNRFYYMIPDRTDVMIYINDNPIT